MSVYACAPILASRFGTLAGVTHTAPNKHTGGGGPTAGLSRIMREITTMRTSLPVQYGAGIWVRPDEDQPHLLKALISGPMDTPYTHGLFEFDICLPPQYPNVPPKVTAPDRSNRGVGND